MFPSSFNMTILDILNALPFNGYKTIIGAVALILYGVGGLFSGHMDQQTAIGFIIAGWTALGIGHKVMKQGQ